MIWPDPLHCGHGCVIEKNPWLSESTPRPLQRGHVVGVVPGLAPVPLQVLQVDCFGTVTVTSVPPIASSKPSETSVSRSRPRAGCWPGPPRPRNMVEKMSPMSPTKSPPARRAAAAAAAEAGEAAAGVVLTALLGVGERVVGLLDLLEALLGRVVARVRVGMVLAREPAVGLLDLLLGGPAPDSERLVVVVRHRGSLLGHHDPRRPQHLAVEPDSRGRAPRRSRRSRRLPGPGRWRAPRARSGRSARPSGRRPRPRRGCSVSSS